MSADSLPNHLRDLTEGDRRLLAYLSVLIHGESAVPESVTDAAKALHDWVAVDAHLAQLADAPVLTRGDDTAYSFVVGPTVVRVEIEPAGYRRRRIAVTVTPDDTAHVEDICLQFPDGTSRSLPPDRYAEHLAEIPSGTVRVIAVLDTGAITTPWFTI